MVAMMTGDQQMSLMQVNIIDKQYGNMRLITLFGVYDLRQQQIDSTTGAVMDVRHGKEKTNLL